MSFPQGDLRLLAGTIAKRLLTSIIPARFAYTSRDGTPRVLPTWFQWTGEELVMGTFVSAPHVKRPATRLAALLANGEKDRGVMSIEYDDDRRACLGRYLDSSPQDPPVFPTIASERYRLKGTFSGDGNTIAGQWEQSSDGSNWRYWYDLTYSKVN